MRAGASAVTQEERARVLLPAKWSGPSSARRLADAEEMLVKLTKDKKETCLSPWI